MIFECIFVVICYEDDLFDVCFECFFYCVLDKWFVDDGQYFFWYCFGGWQEVCVEFGNGEYGFVQVFDCYFGYFFEMVDVFYLCMC